MLGEIVAMLEARALVGQLDGAIALRDRVEPLTAGHFVRWLPRSHRNALALVDDVRAHHGLELERGQETALPFTRITRDTGIPDPEPASKVAQVLGERAARERARRELALVHRRGDAHALMEVRELAASFGEVTVRRFNAAYRQLHPVLDSAGRRQRALALTSRGRMVDVTVRGPQGTEFRISRRADTDERALIAMLMWRIEAAVGVRGIEELTNRLCGERQREPTAATPGSEDHDVDASEDGRLVGEPVGAEERTIVDAGHQAISQGTNPRRPSPTRRAAIACRPGMVRRAAVVRRAGSRRDHRAWQRGLASVHQAQAPPPTRQQGDGQAQSRGPPPNSRQ